MESILKNFKPNLIPNNLKSEPTDFDKIIMKNGGYKHYCILQKKDGCRLELIDGKVLSRELKTPGSKLVVERFQLIAEEFKRLNILVEGEFYMHGQKFNSIFRFFSKSDVTCPKYKLQLEKESIKDPEKFKKDYDGLGVDFLTTFHKDLKLSIFDCIILDKPDLGFEERMMHLMGRISSSEILSSNTDYEVSQILICVTSDEVTQLYNESLDSGYEGLVLVHYDHKYKFGRNSLNQGTLLKMKEDSLEYDGIILDVLEATNVKDGIETTTNNLGRSETSKKKGDRELSGLAKGFLVQFEDKGTFTVSLDGFDNEAKKELLDNKESYIGRHIKYTGMKAVKDFPRHAFFKCWRDTK
jgi:hypothetical protein